MRSVVYAPFLLSILVVGVSRFGVHRLAPRAATWAITVTATALALSTVGALVLLGSLLPARVPAVAAIGRWPPQSITARTPVPLWLSLVALMLAACIALPLCREARRLAGEFSDVIGAHAGLAACGRGEVVVVRSDVAHAHAVSRTVTRRGRVIVTTGLLELLDDEERAAVVAHERAHLRHGHAAFLAIVRVAAALNPLLASMRGDLRYATERWADEEAATVTDPSIIASAIVKAAIAALHVTVPASSTSAMYLHDHAVPERVHALLDRGSQQARLAWMLIGLASVAAASLLWAMHDTERFFEAVRLWHRP